MELNEIVAAEVKKYLNDINFIYVHDPNFEKEMIVLNSTRKIIRKHAKDYYSMFNRLANTQLSIERKKKKLDLCAVYIALMILKPYKQNNLIT